MQTEATPHCRDQHVDARAFFLAWHLLPRNAGFDTPPVSLQLLVLASTRYSPSLITEARRRAVASHLIPLSANSKVTHCAVRPCGVTTSFVTIGCLSYDTCWLRHLGHTSRPDLACRWKLAAIETCRRHFGTISITLPRRGLP